MSKNVSVKTHKALHAVYLWVASSHHRDRCAVRVGADCDCGKNAIQATLSRLMGPVPLCDKIRKATARGGQEEQVMRSLINLLNGKP